MPDLDQIKQGKQGAKDRHGRPPQAGFRWRRTGSRKDSTLVAAGYHDRDGGSRLGWLDNRQMSFCC